MTRTYIKYLVMDKHKYSLFVPHLVTVTCKYVLY
uniref:Uncharacterized protein n=1 Tax=Setaria italica TaxID=4555 RepID=K3ZFM9_SETIT